MSNCMLHGGTSTSFFCPVCQAKKQADEHTAELKKHTAELENHSRLMKKNLDLQNTARSAEASRARKEQENEIIRHHNEYINSLSPEELFEYQKQQELERMNTIFNNAIFEKKETAFSTLKYLAFYWVILSMCYISKYREILLNPSVIDFPYNIIAYFYYFTLRLPYEFLVYLYNKSHYFIFESLPWPNFSWLVFVILILGSIYFSIKGLYNLCYSYGKNVSRFYLFPFLAGIGWYLIAGIFNWLFKR